MYTFYKYDAGEIAIAVIARECPEEDAIAHLRVNFSNKILDFVVVVRHD
ncbi:hypothetical protein [Calothrix sp. PCC 7507]|nr:hypothetical protein [Calothrix sp. PCC 7507]